jgi:hypothetical protein
MGRDIHEDDRLTPACGPAERQERARDATRAPELSREREPVSIRGRIFRVSERERRTMEDIGKFRTIAMEDLVNRYGGNAGRMRQDVRSLAAQGLVQRRPVWLSPRNEKLTVLVLTRAGKDLLEQAPSRDTSQTLYAGFVKPAEVAHDAAIYRMFQAEARRIEQDGGRVRCVVLDYELKQKVYSPLAKVKGLPALDYARRQIEVAQANHLKVVAGKIPLPDLRIEYETSRGDLARVDLELATHHYHGSHLQTKAEAGFKMYAPAEDSGRLSAVLEEREITAAILSL